MVDHVIHAQTLLCIGSNRITHGQLMKIGHATSSRWEPKKRQEIVPRAVGAAPLDDRQVLVSPGNGPGHETTARQITTQDFAPEIRWWFLIG